MIRREKGSPVVTALPPLERRRTRIRDTLRKRTPELQYLVAAVGHRLNAADPESALVYLRELRELADETLRALAPRRRAATR